MSENSSTPITRHNAADNHNTHGLSALRDAGDGSRMYRKPTHVTPRMLDWTLNGIPVYIRRRPADGIVYATTYDFSQYVTDPPLETMRVRVPKDDIRGWDPETDPRVIKVLAKYNRK